VVPVRFPSALLAALVAVVLLPAGDAAAAPPEDPLVVIGTAGVRWDDVSEQGTPALWSLLVDGAVGTIAVRSVRPSACPIDGWLGLSAGRRAADVGTRAPEPQCRKAQGPADGQVPRWDVYVEDAETGSYEARPGLLGQAIAEAGVRATAVGPGAAIALADVDGQVVGPHEPRAMDPRGVAATVDRVVGGSDLLVVDVGAVRDPADLPETDSDRLTGDREGQVQRIDARIGAVLDSIPASSTVVVASLADSGTTPHLQLAAVRGTTPDGDTYADALLGSRSTRQDGLIQTTDLAPTVLALLDVDPPSGLVGSPVVPVPWSTDPADRLSKVLDLDAAAQAQRPLVPWFFNLLVAAQIALYGAATLALRRQWGGPQLRHTVLAWLRRVSVVFAAVPVSTFLANLVPWWRWGNDFVAVVSASAVGTAAVTAIALLGPWRRQVLGPLGVVAGITAGVLAIDVITGSHLQLSSLMGQQPVVAGRFYGLGNPQFALFGTGMVLLATALADAALRAGHRRRAVWTVAVIGLVAVVVDGTPGLGSDFGGPPAMIPAFTLLALMVADVRLTVRRGLLIVAGTLATVTALCVGDWLRPPAQRTHLGRFVQTVLDGGALPVIQRKIEQNIDILFGSYLSALVPIAALFIGVILMRPVAWGAPALQRAYERSPALRPGLTALILMMMIGFAVNDSGTSVPAVAATVAIPLLIAASVRVLEDDDTPSAPGPRHQPATPLIVGPKRL